MTESLVMAFIISILHSCSFYQMKNYNRTFMYVTYTLTSEFTS